MLLRLQSLILGVAVLAAGLLVTGCSSAEKASDEGASMAVMCPKCETVWIREYTDHGPHTRTLVTKPGMTCPTCDKMAKAYLEDQKMVMHECPDCKVTPKVVTRPSREHSAPHK